MSTEYSIIFLNIHIGDEKPIPFSYSVTTSSDNFMSSSKIMKGLKNAFKNSPLMTNTYRSTQRDSGNCAAPKVINHSPIHPSQTIIYSFPTGTHMLLIDRITLIRSKLEQLVDSSAQGTLSPTYI